MLALNRERHLHLNTPQRCTHIKATGHRCGSPALRGEYFCYFHTRMVKGLSAARPTAEIWPSSNLEDAEALQCALMELVQTLYSGQIDYKTASLILRAMHIGVRNMKNIRFDCMNDTMVRDIPDYAQQHRNERPDLFPPENKNPEKKKPQKAQSQPVQSAQQASKPVDLPHPQLQLKSLNSQAETTNPVAAIRIPETRDLQPETKDSKSETPTPKPVTGIPTPETRDLTPDTKDLRPDIQTFRAAAAYKSPAKPATQKKPTPTRPSRKTSSPAKPSSYRTHSARPAHSSSARKPPRPSIIHPDVPLTTRQQKQWNALRDLESSAHRAEKGSFPDMKKVLSATGIFGK